MDWILSSVPVHNPCGFAVLPGPHLDSPFVYTKQALQLGTMMFQRQSFGLIRVNAYRLVLMPKVYLHIKIIYINHVLMARCRTSLYFCWRNAWYHREIYFGNWLSDLRACMHPWRMVMYNTLRIIDSEKISLRCGY